MRWCRQLSMMVGSHVLHLGHTTESKCVDRDIELNGLVSDCGEAGLALDPTHGLTGACSKYFCSTCIYAGACDLSCGTCSYPDWWPCRIDAEEILDCSGQCVGPCQLSSAGYTSCRQWVGDGVCDSSCIDHESKRISSSSDGSDSAGASPGGWNALNPGDCSRISDSASAVNFNCPLYSCDGGDCEQCGTNPPGVPVDAVALRHFLVPPGSGAVASHTSEDFLWPGPHPQGGAGEESNYYPQCRDAALTGANGQPATCAELLVGGEASCAIDFCDGCGPAAGACDASCGVCRPDRNPAAVPWPGRWKSSVGHEIGLNGSPGDFGGSSFDDSGSEHGATGVYGARGISWLIVLTVAVAPLQGMTHTVRSLPLLRMRDYAASLRRWAESPFLASSYDENMNPWAISSDAGDESLWPLLVVESSGANLTALRQAVAEGYASADSAEAADDAHNSSSGRIKWSKERKKGREIEFVSVQLSRRDLGDLSRGKGVAEALSIAKVS